MKVNVATSIDSPRVALADQYAEESSLGKLVAKDLSLSGSELVTEYSLGQNYPNPFNPSTIIKYQVPNEGFITLKVFDVLGREVMTLVQEEKTQGRYEVRLDGSNLASGVYIYRLEAGNLVFTKKMLLMK